MEGVGVVGGEGGQGPGCTGLGARSFSRRRFQLFLGGFSRFCHPHPHPTHYRWLGPWPGAPGPGAPGPPGPTKIWCTRGVDILTSTHCQPGAKRGNGRCIVCSMPPASVDAEAWTCMLHYKYIYNVYIYSIYIYIYIYIYNKYS